VALSETAKELFSSLDVHNLKLRRPLPFIFLCGGPLTPPPGEAKSVREQFLRQGGSRSYFRSEAGIVLAEHVDQAFADRQFDDLLELEKYVATLSEVVVLIVEAPGAIAELGAFSQIPEIAERLFVVVRSGLHPRRSFISLGPLRSLERRESPVSVYAWADFDGDKIQMPPDVMAELINDVSYEINNRPKHEKYSDKKLSHFMLLMAQIIYLARCASTAEIKEALNILGVSIGGRDVGLCLTAMSIVGWVRQEQERRHKYWVVNDAFKPSEYAYRPDVPNDTLRWVSDISEEYKATNDPKYHLFTRLFTEKARALVA